ncbi:MAG: thioesterase [Alphaproteobacteria bacterium]|nr:MAG: thioesterase [Alphaproteobacteria bacterium]
MADTQPDPFPIVDPHQHFWDLSRNYYPWLCDPKPVHFRYGDYSSLKRNYLPPDYLRDAGALNIVKTVHEQANWDPADPAGETRWLEEVQREYGYPHAAVAAAYFARDDVADVLAKHARSKLTRGVRNFPASAPSAAEAKRGEHGSMDDPKWRRGYALLEKYRFSFDVQTPWWHLDALAELARDFPGTQIVIVHTALPHDRSNDALAGWRAALEVAAAQPNVAIKISGLGRPGLPWTLTANGPIIRDTINIFGPERCMFASNFPVDGLAGSFQVIYGGFRAAVSNRPAEERRMLFHDNAVRIYRL